MTEIQGNAERVRERMAPVLAEALKAFLEDPSYAIAIARAASRREERSEITRASRARVRAEA